MELLQSLLKEHATLNEQVASIFKRKSLIEELITNMGGTYQPITLGYESVISSPIATPIVTPSLSANLNTPVAAAAVVKTERRPRTSSNYDRTELTNKIKEIMKKNDMYFTALDLTNRLQYDYTQLSFGELSNIISTILSQGYGKKTPEYSRLKSKDNNKAFCYCLANVKTSYRFDNQLPSKLEYYPHASEGKKMFLGIKESIISILSESNIALTQQEIVDKLKMMLPQLESKHLNLLTNSTSSMLGSYSQPNYVYGQAWEQDWKHGKKVFFLKKK